MPEPITIVGLGGGLLGILAHLARRYFDTAKEVVDILLGAILLVVFSPLIAACALLIKLTSPGNAFYSQVRVGKNGKTFKMYKLRTMSLDAEKGSGPVWASKNDPRVIPVCRWMRRSHVDELPQLINVIRGEMSIVGPRPERPRILEKLQESFPNVHERLAVRPGITGLAQIRNGYDIDSQHFRHKLAADLEYIAKRRWTLDLSILARTIAKFRDAGAH